MNDYAGLLREEERARLETLLAERERATGAQMVIAIFRSLEGEALEDYSIRLAQRWRIGQKGLDNGVILLVFLAERRLRLEVGYGLESTLTDAVADRIIRDVIAPPFREGRHAAALEETVREVFSRIAGAGTPSPATPSWPQFLALGFIVIVILLVVATASRDGGDGRTLKRGRRMYTAGPRGWYVPPISTGGGWGRWSGGGGFSGGGGSFGGGGASGRW